MGHVNSRKPSLDAEMLQPSYLNLLNPHVFSSVDALGCISETDEVGSSLQIRFNQIARELKRLALARVESEQRKRHTSVHLLATPRLA